MTNEIKESILIVRAIKEENTNSERIVSQCERMDKLLNPDSNEIKNGGINVSLIVCSLIIGLIWQAFVYSCISFYNLDTNPFNWSKDSRFIMVFVGFFVSLIISVSFSIANKK